MTKVSFSKCKLDRSHMSIETKDTRDAHRVKGVLSLSRVHGGTQNDDSQKGTVDCVLRGSNTVIVHRLFRTTTSKKVLPKSSRTCFPVEP